MKNIFGSSRRLTMLLLVVTTCVAFIVGKISPELFMGVVTTVIAFFFGQRSSEQSNTPPVEPTKIEVIEAPKQ